MRTTAWPRSTRLSSMMDELFANAVPVATAERCTRPHIVHVPIGSTLDQKRQRLARNWSREMPISRLYLLVHCLRGCLVPESLEPTCLDPDPMLFSFTV